MKRASATCPECGSDLSANDADQPSRCANPDCPAAVRAALTRWCAPEAMSIAVTESLVASLVRLGLVLDVADFYRLKLGELLELEGMNEVMAKDFLAAITASKARDWWRVLIGLGLPTVDAQTAQALARNFRSLDDLALAPRARLLAATNELMAESITHWFSDARHRKLIKRLRKAGLKLD